LQCLAVSCGVLSVLQCVTVCCSVLQCVAVCCSVLQCVAVCNSLSQCVAVCCSVLQLQCASLSSNFCKIDHPILAKKPYFCNRELFSQKSPVFAKEPYFRGALFANRPYFHRGHVCKK